MGVAFGKGAPINSTPLPPKINFLFSHGLELNMNSAFALARAMLVSLLGFLGDSFFR
jgi:hypothetical protein